MLEISICIGLALTAASLLSAIVLMLKTKDELTRAVISDMCFYGMIAFYLIWSLRNPTSIAYEVVLLAGLVGGALPTMSVARIISKGRR
ncbi:cation:proton antiporter [Corynebacterium diphtheriae]